MELSNILFTGENGNGIFDAGENSFISFTLTNRGEGEVTDVIVLLDPKRKKAEALSYEPNTSIGYVYSGQSR